MPSNDLFQNDSTPDHTRHPARRPASFAGMGYRLAAAGPRTRQRLIERESGFPPPEEVRYAHPILASAPDADSWTPPAPELAEERLSRVSVLPSRLTVWRAAALLGCSACGFSMVLFGQSLHLERTLHASAKAKQGTAPIEIASVPAAAAAPARIEEVALDGHDLAAAPSVETATLPPGLRAMTVAAHMAPSPAPDLVADPRPAAPRVLVFARQPVYPLASPRRVAVTTVAAVAPLPVWHSPPRHLAQRDYALPSWLTKPPAPPAKPQVMSPPPHNLDEPAQTAPAHDTQLAGQAPPTPQRTLPPSPPAGVHRPQIIYAEAHYPQPEPPPPPPPSPYYQPAYGYGYGGYYGYQPYPYPRSSW